jgi:hypothetical protein
MFRHSEIHQLQRARQLQRERLERGEQSQTNSPEPEPEKYEEPLAIPKGGDKIYDDGAGGGEGEGKGEEEVEEEEREYEAFLAREREDLAGGREEEGRLCEGDPLPYDDGKMEEEEEQAVISHAKKQGTERVEEREVGMPGRKRLWYGDVDEGVPEDPFAKRDEEKEKVFLWPEITPVADQTE